MSTKVRNTADDTGTDSTKDSDGDSIDLYKRYITAVREWVDANPIRGTPEWKRLEGELRAACAGSTYRWRLTRRLLDPSTNVDYTAVPLDGSITWSALHCAAWLQSADLVNILLSSGRWTKINRRDWNGATPLMTACDDLGFVLTPTEKDQSDRRQTVETLLRYSADVHCRDDRGRTALQIALEKGHQECAKLLLRAGSSIADLMDAVKGDVIGRLIQDQTRDTSKYMAMLQKRRGKTENPGAQSPIQVPINLLGDSQAGKSSVAASLNKKRPFRVPEADRTVGAEITQILAHGMNFRIYDFGGHGTYAFPHHLYLPQFGIHVVFIKVDCEFDAEDCSLQLNRWMYFLSSKIPAPRVLVVLSKVDLLSDDELQQAVDGLQLKLKMMENEEREAVDVWSLSNKSALSSLQIDGKNLPGYETIKKNLKDAEAVKRDRPKIVGDILCVSCEEGRERGLDEFLKRCATAVNEADAESVDGGRHFFRLSEFPESWNVFLEALLKYQGNGQLALPMSKVRQMADEAGISEEDVDLCLFLFKAMGHIIHYENPEKALNQYVFHDPELLAKSMGQLVHHDLVKQFRFYITSTVNHEDGDAIRSDFRNGLVPLDFLKSQLNHKYPSEGGKFADAVVHLSTRIGLCVPVHTKVPQGRQMVFIPSLVKRPRSEVEEDLRKKWGPVEMKGWDDFVMDLRFHRGLPIGFVERVIVEASLFTSGNFNFLNGFFAKGWDDCLILLEEESQPLDKFCRLRFKIRTESSNKGAAIQNMTWLYYVFQTVLSYYPGVLAHAVTPCKCSEKVYDVKGCLNQSYEVLKTIKCSACPTWEHRSAADVFPVKTPDPAGDLSGAKCAGEASSISAAPREMSRLERIERHSDIVTYLSEALTDRQIATLVTTMVLQEILPGKLKFERDIHTVLMVLCDTMFIAPGKYTDLYKFLVKRSICDVAQDLKHKADQLFGPLSWE